MFDYIKLIKNAELFFYSIYNLHINVGCEVFCNTCLGAIFSLNEGYDLFASKQSNRKFLFLTVLVGMKTYNHLHSIYLDLSSGSILSFFYFFCDSVRLGRIFPK